MPARLTSDLSSSLARSISYLRSCETSLAATETRSPMDWSVPLDGMRLTAGSAMWYLPLSALSAQSLAYVQRQLERACAIEHCGNDGTSYPGPICDVSQYRALWCPGNGDSNSRSCRSTANGAP